MPISVAVMLFVQVGMYFYDKPYNSPVISKVIDKNNQVVYLASTSGVHYTDIDQYHKANQVGKWSGSIFMIAVAVYVIGGLINDTWNTLWIVFPIAVFVNIIISIIFGKEGK